MRALLIANKLVGHGNLRAITMPLEAYIAGIAANDQVDRMRFRKNTLARTVVFGIIWAELNPLVTDTDEISITRWAWGDRHREETATAHWFALRRQGFTKRDIVLSYLPALCDCDPNRGMPQVCPVHGTAKET